MSIFMIIVYSTCFRLVLSYLNRINRFALLRYKILRYLCICLTEIKTVDVRVSTHRKEFSDCILLIACHVVKNKYRTWKRLVWWNNIAIIGECKIKFLQSGLINSPSILTVATISSICTCSRNVRHVDFPVNLSARFFCRSLMDRR